MIDNGTKTFLGSLFFLGFFGIMGSNFATPYFTIVDKQRIIAISWILGGIIAITNIWRNTNPKVISEYVFFLSFSCPFMVCAIQGFYFITGNHLFTALIIFFEISVWFIPFVLKDKSHQFVSNSKSTKTKFGKALLVIFILITSFGVPFGSQIGKLSSRANDGGFMYMTFHGIINCLLVISISSVASFYSYTKYHPIIGPVKSS
jgi:hypothetical protein